MNSVYNNNFNITIVKLQEFLEKNYIKLGFSEKGLSKVIKSLRKRSTTKSMRSILYHECLKKLESEYIKNENIKHLTSSDRQVIELFHKSGFTQSFTGYFLKKHRSSICREINSKKYQIENINSKKSPILHPNEMIDIYDAKKAQRMSEISKLNSRKMCLLDKDIVLRDAVVGLLKNGKTNDGVRYSPEAIAALSKNNKIEGVTSGISSGVIYRSVKNRKYGLTVNDLPHGRHYYKSTAKHTKAKEVPENKKDYSIEIMPQDLKDKTNEFFWEGDSVIGKRDGTNNTVITMVNVASKFLIIERAKDKTAQSFVNVLNNLEERIPVFKNLIQYLLLDNGCEFSAIQKIIRSKFNEEEKRLMIYFAHPYASYERGLNENTNGLVRRDIIKGVNINNYSDEKILNVARKLNNMPRKSLNWMTPLEKIEEILVKNNLTTEWLDQYRMPLCKYLVS